MAKSTLLKLSLVVALSLAASSVYAATKYTGATAVGGTSFSASNKVHVYGKTNGTTASGFDNTAYGIASAHESGDKVIGSKSGDAKLYFTTTNAGAATGTASTIADTTDLTAWTSM